MATQSPTIVSPYVSRTPDYSDLDLNFMMNPSTGDINILTGEQDIKRAVRNLIMTNFYERKFQSYIGSDVNALLFDLATPLTAVYLKDAIANVINNFEPRVSLIEVDITPDYDRNGFEVRLIYVIKNREQPVVTSIFLERIREVKWHIFQIRLSE